MAEIRYERATAVYPGADTAAVQELDLEIAKGELLVLVGPSGSGKTTALRMLAGLEEVYAGNIFIGDRDVTDLPPKDRDVAMVFQNYALYPFLDVEANIAFPLRMEKVPKPERQRRVREVAELLELERIPRAQAEPTLRRATPAGGHGPGDRARAGGVPDGRAALQPRREAAGPDARRDLLAAEPARGDDGLRHARPGRGDDDGPSRGGPQGRAPPAVRFAPRAL